MGVGRENFGIEKRREAGLDWGEKGDKDRLFESVIAKS
jgi:hypothetical protein